MKKNILKYTNFNKSKDLKSCTFKLPKTLGGYHILETVYDSNLVKPDNENYLFSYNDLFNLSNFMIRTTKRPFYKCKTAKSFLNKL